MGTTALVRSVLTPQALFRLLLGWGAFGGVLLAGPFLSGPLPAAVSALVLTGIIAVIVTCAFGVVTEAEHLARRLGDPYGTLVLTLSIVMIEVILISAVMFGPGEHPTIGRDSVMAVSMIILNLVIGVALIVGGARHAALRPNRTGVFAYVSVLVVLIVAAFALPGLIGVDGAYTPVQAVVVGTLTVVLYVFFLYRQMGAQREDFQEDPAQEVVTPAAALPMDSASAGRNTEVERAEPAPIMEVLARHRAEVVARAGLLIVMVIPIVLLSHDMAALLDDGLGRLGAPIALSGLLIAMIVFLPETITAVRAAHAGEIQRVSNLCHGALVSTVGLTIPSVLGIGLLTGQTVVLAEGPTNLVLLGATLLLTVSTFTGGRVTTIHGAAHLMVFLIYGLTVFS